MRHTKIRLATLAALTAPIVALAGPASAATHYKWIRSTTGAAGHGYVYRSNGYLKNHWTIKDTKADGHCAYVNMWQANYVETSAGSVWVGGKSHRRRICQRGHSASGTDKWSIAGSITPFTTKIRIDTQVCRDINNHPDNCSDVHLSRSWDV